MANFNLTKSRLTETQMTTLCQKRPIRMNEDGSIMTGPVRLSFPSLHEKTAFGQGVPKYQSALLFPHKNLTTLMDALRAALKGFYPTVVDPSVFLDPFNKDHPIRDQSLKVNVAEGGRNALKPTLEGYVPSFAFINPKSEKYQPQCFHVVRGQWVAALPEEIEKMFYAGAWVDAKINVYKNGGNNPGAALGLTAVWKLADDEGFGGGKGGASASDGGSAADAFTAEDPNNLPASEDPPWG